MCALTRILHVRVCLAHAQVWPFRRDVSFIRGIFLAAFLASLMVAGGIVFGAWLVGWSAQGADSDATPLCNSFACGLRCCRMDAWRKHNVVC